MRYKKSRLMTFDHVEITRAIDRIADSSPRGSFNDGVETEEFSPMVMAMPAKRSLENGA
jgi:hypothetical protein